jgi:CspA family cold shock protein
VKRFENQPDEKIMQTGKLKKWIDDRDFGFIKPDGGGPDVFVHRTELRRAGIDPYALSEGAALSFDIGLDRDNRAAAVNVQLAE